ncbi:murein biosynthesis integral membrane protein MurJ [Peribacillus sp. FSL E2-0159]|uniref:murein biosynthesis integral membrane protein MurJ n=1 Tax=Peribacillus sp. FSL E2-0159 TaxID=2975289 RepID=UPI003159D147
MAKLKITLIVVLILSLSSKGLGFFRDILITNYVGFNEKTDAIFVAISICTLLFSIFNTTIRTTFAPMFSANFLQDPITVIREYKEIRRFLILVMFVTSLLVFFFPGIFIKIITPGLSGETLTYALIFLKYLSFIIFLYGVFFISTGFLQSMNIFQTVEYGNLFNNMVIVTFIFLFYKHMGINSVIFGLLFGAFIQALYGQLRLHKRIKRYKVKNEKNLFNYHKIKQFIKNSQYILFGSMVSQLTVLSDKFVASFLNQGSITALHYSNVLKNLPLNIIVLVVTNILFTNLSIYYVKNKEKFNFFITEQIKYLLFLISPIFIMMFVYSEEIVRLLYFRGAFTERGVEMTSQALMAYSAGLFFIVIKEVLTKVCYAAKNTKLPLLVSILSLIINLVFNFILSYYFYHIGIAIATTISVIINCFVLLYYLNKFNVIENVKLILVITFKYSLMLLITLVSIYSLKNTILINFSDRLNLLFGLGMIFIIYISFHKKLGIDLKLLRVKR